MGQAFGYSNAPEQGGDSNNYKFRPNINIDAFIEQLDQPRPRSDTEPKLVYRAWKFYAKHDVENLVGEAIATEPVFWINRENQVNHCRLPVGDTSSCFVIVESVEGANPLSEFVHVDIGAAFNRSVTEVHELFSPHQYKNNLLMLEKMKNRRRCHRIHIWRGKDVNVGTACHVLSKAHALQAKLATAKNFEAIFDDPLLAPCFVRDLPLKKRPPMTGVVGSGAAPPPGAAAVQPPRAAASSRFVPSMLNNSPVKNTNFFSMHVQNVRDYRIPFLSLSTNNGLKLPGTTPLTPRNLAQIGANAFGGNPTLSPRFTRNNDKNNSSLLAATKEFRNTAMANMNTSPPKKVIPKKQAQITIGGAKPSSPMPCPRIRLSLTTSLTTAAPMSNNLRLNNSNFNATAVSTSPRGTVDPARNAGRPISAEGAMSPRLLETKRAVRGPAVEEVAVPKKMVVPGMKLDTPSKQDDNTSSSTTSVSSRKRTSENVNANPEAFDGRNADDIDLAHKLFVEGFRHTLSKIPMDLGFSAEELANVSSSSSLSEDDNLSALPEDVAREIKMSKFQKQIQRFPDKVQGKYVYICGRYVAENKQQLLDEGITHIINTAGDVVPSSFPESFEYKTYYLKDGTGEDLQTLFFFLLDFLEEAFAANSDAKILFHCVEGISRSATMMLSFLMWRLQKPFFTCLERVQEHRRICNPNRAFITNLTLWQRDLLINDENKKRPDSRFFRIKVHAEKAPFFYLFGQYVHRDINLNLDPRFAYVCLAKDKFNCWIGPDCVLSAEFVTSLVEQHKNRCEKYLCRRFATDFIKVGNPTTLFRFHLFTNVWETQDGAASSEDHEDGGNNSQRKRQRLSEDDPGTTRNVDASIVNRNWLDSDAALMEKWWGNDTRNEASKSSKSSPQKQQVVDESATPREIIKEEGTPRENVLDVVENDVAVDADQIDPLIKHELYRAPEFDFEDRITMFDHEDLESDGVFILLSRRQRPMKVFVWVGEEYGFDDDAPPIGLVKDNFLASRGEAFFHGEPEVTVVNEHAEPADFFDYFED